MGRNEDLWPYNVHGKCLFVDNLHGKLVLLYKATRNVEYPLEFVLKKMGYIIASLFISLENVKQIKLSKFAWNERHVDV